MSLEWDPEIRVAPVEENSVLDTSLDEVYFALQLLESNRQLSLANRRTRAYFMKGKGLLL